MIPLISIIIPNYNGAATLEPCLRAATAVEDAAMEIIVVDDGSQDQSVEIINRYPCKLIRLTKRAGAARARNVGARHSRGEILLFTDADCVLHKDSLSLLRRRMSASGAHVVIGGSYTPQPYDGGFFSRFQSVFIHYAETKHLAAPDYVATHAMAIWAETFHASGGFNENMGPILEDVEFSHRLRRDGCKLQMEAGLLVQHIFNFSLRDSWQNAIRKTRYWILYSLRNQDLLADSGTASVELKFNVGVFYSGIILLLLGFAGSPTALLSAALLTGANLYFNRGLLKAVFAANGSLTGFGITLYYLLVYPIPVGIGAAAGLLGYLHQHYRILRVS